ncbi:MAG: hypothetical protein ABI793_09345 [Flavobacterium sp.]
MKHLLSILLILTLSFQGFSQKKAQKGSKPKTKKITAIQEAQPAIVKKIIDTLHIQKGKPCILLVNVNKDSADAAISYDSNSEENELIRNFGKEALQIININKYTYVVFENKQTIDINPEGESFQAFAYWSGKLKDKIKIQQGKRMATEFVAGNMKVKKESSYVINTRKYKKEVASLESKNKITPKSNEIMNAFLNKIILSIDGKREDEFPLFKENKSKIKTASYYFLAKNGTKTPIKEVLVNENGLLKQVKNYNRKGELNGEENYVYEYGMLTKIIRGDQTTTIRYNDDKMIFSDIRGDANETAVYRLENNVLLENSYIIMTDDKFCYMNSFTEEKIEDNCILRYINNILWTKNCGSPENVFPFVFKYTSYQDGNVLQYRKSKLEKQGEKKFDKYYSSAEREEEKEVFNFFGTLEFNENNLLDTYRFTKDKISQVIKVDYTYYPN